MADNNSSPIITTRKRPSVLLWIIFFIAIGYIGMMLVLLRIDNYCSLEEMRRRHLAMTEQMEMLKNGEINCLVHPDPLFLDEILADNNVAAKIQYIYLGGDLSDERLVRLKELPHLRCIISLSAQNLDIFLDRIRGMSTIEELSLERSSIGSQKGVESLSSFPNLKSLCFSIKEVNSENFKCLINHPKLEKLFLVMSQPDESLIPVLKKMPHLRSITIQTQLEDAKPLERLLCEALPEVECCVQPSAR
jgi:hypothetical protein